MQIFLVNLIFPQPFCHLGDTPVIIGIFHCFGGALVVVIVTDKTNIIELAQSKPVTLGIIRHRLQGEFGIKIPDAFLVGIYYYRDGMIADHTECFLAAQLPHRQHTAMLVLT